MNLATELALILEREKLIENRSEVNEENALEIAVKMVERLVMSERNLADKLKAEREKVASFYGPLLWKSDSR
jgi:hypothetical protein